MQQQDRLAQRTLTTGGWLTAAITLTLVTLSHSGWAWSFLVGAMLSLFSVLSLTIVIPILFRPGMPRGVTALLGLTMFMKLPLYAAGLYLFARVAGGSAPALLLGVAGLALAPIVIVGKTLGNMAVEASGGWLPAPTHGLRTDARSGHNVGVQQNALAIGEGV